MKMYECITRIMELSGWTFDEALTYIVVILVGCAGGIGFLFSVYADLGRYLYCGMKKLFRFIIRRVRHKGKARP